MHMHLLRVPVPSSIYNKPTPDETLSALQEVNTFLPAPQKLPEELILRVNNDAHTNLVYEQARSAWTPITDEEQSQLIGWDSMLGYSADAKHNEVLPLGTAKLQVDARRYGLGESQPESGDTDMARFAEEYSTKMKCFWKHISAADLLYRLRCFFPEIYVTSVGPSGCNFVWSAGLRHRTTGMGLGFSEWKGGALLRVDWSTVVDANWRFATFYPGGRRLLKKMKKAGTMFSMDAIRLLNAFFETTDGKRLAYFHPAADADFPTDDEHYPAVPRSRKECPRNELGEPQMDDRGPQTAWQAASVEAADLTSFKSLLPNMKYNLESRHVDIINGTADLTTIISSSLLFYRLLCQYQLRGHNNINTTPPIITIWQVKLIHRQTGIPVLFMDHHGFFDIRAGDEAKGVMEDIVALVTFLCSDECYHPYGMVSGWVA